MSQIAQENSLFDIDQELDFLLDEIQEASETDDGDVHADLLARFQEYCDAHVEKVDRIGHFLSVMAWRAQFCRTEATRLHERARAAENKVEKTKSMVLYYLRSRDLRKIEGREFTLRAQKNSQDSVIIRDDALVPPDFRDVEARIPGRVWQELLGSLSEDVARILSGCVQHTKPNNEAIKQAAAIQESVPGAEVRRGFHLRVV
jgi:hypothetical protein